MVRLDFQGKGSGFEEGSVIQFNDDNFEDTLKLTRNKQPLKRSGSLSLLNPHREKGMQDYDSEASVESSPNISFSSRNHSQPLDLDLVLESSTAVEGSSLNGHITIKASKDVPNLLVGPAKIRVVGFEAVPHDRHTFYQHSAPLEATCPSLNTIFLATSDREVFKKIKPGKHQIPFSFHLPRLLGAKGSVTSHSRLSVRYIVLVYVLASRSTIQTLDHTK